MTTKGSTDANKPKVGLALDIDQLTGRATAVLSPDEPVQDISNQDILQQLSDEGAADWFADKNAIDDVVKKAKKHIATRIIVAQRKDASCQVKITDDNMSAVLRVTPACGGEPLYRDDIIQELTDKRIDPSRILKSGLDEAIQCTEEKDITVARGALPVTGKDSQFIPLVQNDDEERVLTEDDKGRVDFYAGKTYSTVEAGTPILERQPPKPGTAGMDIFGQALPANPGKELPFAKTMSGTELASNDPNLLIAKISGHPVFFKNGARVDNSLTLDSVSVATGHVSFNGSVEVKGDVMPEMKVEASGDVFIKGTVERAKIVSGHNIHIGGGVLGDTSITVEEGDKLPTFECTLEATGNIMARYINLASLTAGQSIEIREYAFHSRLNAGENIALGQQGGRGNLVGGESTAGQSVVAKTLGNRAYNSTRIRVGMSHEDWQTVQQLKFLRDQRLSQARNLRKVLDQLKTKGSVTRLGQLEIDRAKKVHDTLLKLQQAIKVIDQQLAEITHNTEGNHEPYVSATVACYPNCAFTINGVQLVSKQEHNRITFVKRGAVVTAK